jgi:hypothetical protein
LSVEFVDQTGKEPGTATRRRTTPYFTNHQRPKEEYERVASGKLTPNAGDVPAME